MGKLILLGLVICISVHAENLNDDYENAKKYIDNNSQGKIDMKSEYNSKSFINKVNISKSDLANKLNDQKKAYSDDSNYVITKLKYENERINPTALYLKNKDYMDSQERSIDSKIEKEINPNIKNKMEEILNVDITKDYNIKSNKYITSVKNKYEESTYLSEFKNEYSSKYNKNGLLEKYNTQNSYQKYLDDTNKNKKEYSGQVSLITQKLKDTRSNSVEAGTAFMNESSKMYNLDTRIVTPKIFEDIENDQTKQIISAAVEKTGLKAFSDNNVRAFYLSQTGDVDLGKKSGTEAAGWLLKGLGGDFVNGTGLNNFVGKNTGENLISTYNDSPVGITTQFIADITNGVNLKDAGINLGKNPVGAQTQLLADITSGVGLKKSLKIYQKNIADAQMSAYENSFVGIENQFFIDLFSGVGFKGALNRVIDKIKGKKE